MTKKRRKTDEEKLKDLLLKMKKKEEKLAFKIGKYVLKKYKHIKKLDEFEVLLKQLEKQEHN